MPKGTKRSADDQPKSSVKIGVDGSGRIIDVKIPRRPVWSADTKANVPTDSGEDRRHVVPWILLREQIAIDLKGKTWAEAQAYLMRQGIDVGDAALESIRSGVQNLATQRFNDIDNLWAGPSAQNRILGANILSAEKMLSERDTYKYPFIRPFKIVDADTGKTSIAMIPFENEQEVIEWAFNMNIDWLNKTDIEKGEKFFKDILKARGIELFEEEEAEDAANKKAKTDDGPPSAKESSAEMSESGTEKPGDPSAPDVSSEDPNESEIK